jgi:hypothetical protein
LPLAFRNVRRSYVSESVEALDVKTLSL